MNDDRSFTHESPTGPRCSLECSTAGRVTSLSTNFFFFLSISMKSFSIKKIKFVYNLLIIYLLSTHCIASGLKFSFFNRKWRLTKNTWLPVWGFTCSTKSVVIPKIHQFWFEYLLCKPEVTSYRKYIHSWIAELLFFGEKIKIIG